MVSKSCRTLMQRTPTDDERFDLRHDPVAQIRLPPRDLLERSHAAGGIQLAEAHKCCPL
jgi:hypothetical protein